MLFGSVGAEDSDLRGQVQNDFRQNLRKYLKEGLQFALSQDDFRGHLKAYLAVALARVGDPEDMADLYRLIRADIVRVRRGLTALSRGERGPSADGAVMRWTTWHIRALTWLDPLKAEKILFELLSEPEYQEDAARALVQLAKTSDTETGLLFKKVDYRLVWDARSGRQPSGFDEDRRRRYAITIKERTAGFVEERSKSDNPDSFNRRLKELAKSIAVLDGRDSTDFVMEILALPGEWDGWTQADALEALLFSGAQLDAEATLRVLDPTMDHTQNRLYDQQEIYLLRRCLCLLPFLHPPSTGIARIREVLAGTPFPRYELREVLTALGHSRCDDAFRFLLEVATANRNGFKSIAGEWIDALAVLDTLESRRALLSFVDPDLDQLGLEHHLEYHDRERLASHIAEIACGDPAVRDHLYVLCARQLQPGIRSLVADVVVRLGTAESLRAGLDLIHDQAEPPIPYELVRGLENVFVERRPHGDTGYWYTLHPRSANEIRSRLFYLVLNDHNRRCSAWALLGQIESWRLEYGRPSNESRHPAFDSGEPWPPLEMAGYTAAAGSDAFK